jgi:hypothetical protein
MKTEIHAAEPTSFENGTAIEKLKRYKSPHIDKIPAELIQVLLLIPPCHIAHF